MKLGRTALSLAVALSLGAAGMIGWAGTAAAASPLSAANVDEGQNVTISIASGACAPTDQMLVDVERGDGVKIALKAMPGATSVVLAAPIAQYYEATLTCLSYDSGATVAGSTSFAVWPIILDLPAQWLAGDPITIKGYGFTPQESVSLQIRAVSTGEVVWSDRTVGRADDEGVFSYRIVLKSDLPTGSYVLIASGDRSRVERHRGFYWGSPDEPVEPIAPGSQDEVPGLPATGA